MREPARTPVSLVQLIPNMVTLAGMSLGLTSVRFAIEGRVSAAAFLIVMAVLIDGLDGLLARRLRAASELGAQLDSLSDFLSFGVAPTLLVYHVYLGAIPGVGWVFALLFVAASALRLARFNVLSGKAEAGGEDRHHFTGVPAPAAAMLALMPMFADLSGSGLAKPIPFLVAIWLGLVATLMVSKLKTISPKALRVHPRQVVLVFVLTVSLVGLTLTRPWLLLVVLDLAYIVYLVAAILRVRGRIFS